MFFKMHPKCTINQSYNKYKMQSTIETIPPIRTTKKPTCCSYCKNPGHTINKCIDPTIDILHNKAINAAIFSVCITTINYERTEIVNSGGINRISYERNTFMMRWLMLEYTQKELCILGHKLKCFNKIEDNKDCFLIELAINYIENQLPNRIPINMLDAIPDETFHYLARVFVETVKGYEYRMGKILYYLRPPQRRFKIETMMLCTETAEELQETKTECPICLSHDIKCINKITTNCQHTYCSPCLQGYFKSLNQKHTEEPKCALCRTKMCSLEFKSVELHNEITDKYIDE